MSLKVLFLFLKMPELNCVEHTEHNHPYNVAYIANYHQVDLM